MKKTKPFLILLLITLVLASCAKHDPTPSVEEQQLQLLLGSWGPGTVVVDGTDITSDYSGFKLTFFKDGTDTKLAATNPGNAFGSGAESWTFVAGTQGSKIKRSSDDVEMGVVVDKTSLTLTFTVAPPDGGRVTGVEGQFTFQLVKK